MKLTQAQRNDLFRGDTPKIVFSGSKPCPVKVGHVEHLSANVRLEVTAIRRTRKGEWSLAYTLHNHNLGTRFIARHDDYAHHPHFCIDEEAGEAVDEFTQARLTAESRANEQQRKAKDAAELFAAMRELRMVIDAMPADRKRRISRTLWQLRSRLDTAEREMLRRMIA